MSLAKMPRAGINQQDQSKQPTGTTGRTLKKRGRPLGMMKNGKTKGGSRMRGGSRDLQRREGDGGRRRLKERRRRGSWV